MNSEGPTGESGSVGGYRRWTSAEVSEWVAPQVPSSIILGLGEGEFEHFRKFNTEYGRWVAQFEVHFTRLVNAIENVDFIEKSDWPTHRATQFIFVTNTLRSFWSAADRLHRGAYQDSLTLLRLAYEVWARVVFMSCHPIEYLSGVAPSVPKGIHEFKMTNFLREELRLDWSKTYELLSLFAHGKLDTFVAVLEHSKNPGPRRHEVTVEFDAARCDFAITHFNFVLLLYVHFVKSQLLADAPMPLRSSHDDSDEILRTCLFDDPKPFWATKEADLEYLAELLATAEAGGNWKAIAESRPKIARLA